MTDRRTLVDRTVRWLRDESLRRLARFPLSPEQATELQRGCRMLLRGLRAAVEAGDFERALMFLGNDSDVGFRFVEAALPFVPASARASFVEHAWTHGSFGEHAFVSGRRVRGVDLVRRTNAVFRQVPELRPELPEVVVAFRGVTGPHPERGALHPSWTLRRDIAAWFAMRLPDRRPHVLMAWFPRESVYAVFDSRDEAEVVVDAFAAAGVIVNELTDEDRIAVEAIHQKRREQVARLLAKTSRTGGQPTTQS